MPNFDFQFDEEDIPGSLAKLMRYMRWFTANQDASNVKLHAWGDSLADNLDSTHKFKMNFYVPQGALKVNKFLLNFNLEKFRAYTTGADSGGGQTTSDGGGQTTSDGGGQTTSDGGGTTVTALKGNTSAVSADGTYLLSDTLITGDKIMGSYVSGWIESESDHTHSIDSVADHQHDFFDTNTWADGTNNSATDTTDNAGGHDHTGDTGSDGSHTHRIYNHSHKITHEHGVNIPDHTHTVSDHTHTVSDHTHTVSDHTHDDVYGIYEGTTPNEVKIYVDGTLVDDNGGSGYASDQANVNLTEHVTASGWHTIELSTSRLGRINAAYFIECYIGDKGVSGV